MPLLQDREFKALLLFARFTLGTSDRDELTSHLSSGINWERLIHFAEINSLTPLVYKTLCAIDGFDIAEPARDAIAKKSAFSAANNLLLANKLFSLLSLLKDNQVPAMALKGPALSDELYGDLTLRQCSDIDLLIRREDIQTAKKLITQNGFVPQFTLSEVNEKRYIESQYFYNFFDPNEKIALDLHWGINTPGFGFSPDTTIFFEHTKSIELMGTDIDILSDENLIIMLSVHGGKHLWCQLNWILDFAMALKSDEIDWERALNRLEKMGATTMFLSGLEACDELLGMTPPEKITGLPYLRNSLKKLNKNSNSSLYFGKPLHGIFDYHLPYLLSMDNQKDRLRYIYELLMKPTPNEWSLIELPRVFGFLYYILRPLRLASKAIKSTLSEVNK